MNLEQLLELAYRHVDSVWGLMKISMTPNSAVNQPQYTQTFETIVLPYNNRTQRPAPNG